jgi:hypothetical protein
MISFGTTLLFGIVAQADGMTINCQDTLSDSNIKLELFDTNQIDNTTVKLIANAGEFKVNAVTIESTDDGIKNIIATSQESTVKFDYAFKNLNVAGCFGTAEPTKENPTHVEVIAWNTVVSWVQCGCVRNQ